MRKMKNTRVICLLLTISILLGFGGQRAYAEEDVPALSENVRVSSRFLELLFGEERADGEQIYLIPGGGTFGVKIKQQHVSVVESNGIPAIKAGDKLLSINGRRVETAAEVKGLIEECGGETVTVRVLRDGAEIGVEIRPRLHEGKYSLGLTLRDGAAGLGTLTYIDPKTGCFGGLGHGICDADDGGLVEMRSGDVCGVILGGVHRGESGKPGELCGVLTEKDLGDLYVNSDCGVFGVLSDQSLYSGEAIPIGTRNQISEGSAQIISTIKNGKTARYNVEIYDIDLNSQGSKSFRIRVTDETLKAMTGGIVRGMSGSPIIQNGKLVGAVTHVLIGDPTEGYGIFIENMLNAAEIPRAKAS